MRRLFLYFILILVGCTAADNKIDAVDIWLPEYVTTVDEETGVYESLRVAVPFYNVNLKSGFPYINPTLVYAAKNKFQQEFHGWEVIVQSLESDSILDTVRQGYSDDDMYAWLRSAEPPDVIMQGIWDFNELAKNEHLVNLKPLLDGDARFNKDNYLPFVFMETEDPYAQYYIPISFSMPVLYMYVVSWLHDGPIAQPEQQYAHESWTWDEMILFFNTERVKAKHTRLFSQTPEELTRFFLSNYHAYLYNHTTSQYDFNAPIFTEVVTNIKKLYEDGLMKESSVLPNSELFDLNADTIDSGIQQSMFMSNDSSGILQGAFMDTDAMDYSQFVHRPGTYYPLPVMGGIDTLAVAPMQAFGINANSQNPEKAWEFIKLLLSEDIQNGYNDYYLPLVENIDHIPVLAELDGQAVKQAKGAFRGQSDEQVKQYNHARRLIYDRVDRLYWLAATPALVRNEIYGRPTVMDIVIKHCLDFYRGEASLENIIRNINNEVAEWLEE